MAGELNSPERRQECSPDDCHVSWGRIKHLSLWFIQFNILTIKIFPSSIVFHLYFFANTKLFIYLCTDNHNVEL